MDITDIIGYPGKPKPGSISGYPSNMSAVVPKPVNRNAVINNNPRTGDAGLSQAIAFQNSQNQQQPTGGGPGPAPKRLSPDSLYVDPSAAYKPTLDYLALESKNARNRYATNKADITNIFGSLTSLTAEDSARIKEQFTKTIAEQQAGVAARTAEARAGAAAGLEQAAATGAERGAGPGMAINPLSVATEEGVARSNEYQTTWEALQNANQMQAQADLSARGAGYGQQQLGAVRQLSNQLEDRLLEIGGNTAKVKSDIAQAKFQQQKEIAGVKYQNSERAYAAWQQRAAAAASKPNYGNDMFGLQARINNDLGDQGYGAVQSGVANAYTQAYGELNKNNAPGAKPIEPSKAQVLAAWSQTGDPRLTPYVSSYAGMIYK